MSSPRRYPLAGTTLVALAIALAGCGHTAATLTSAPAGATAPQAQNVSLQLADTTGNLEIHLAQAKAAGYHVQATVSQVASLTVTLSGGPLTTPMSQTVTTSQLSNNQGAVDFSNVPNGQVAVTIAAFDASGKSLGSTSTSATIAGGQTAVVNVSFQLDPTHVASTNGNVDFNLTLQDGQTIVDPIASPSPQPSVPVLPTATPTPTPRITVVSGPLDTWYADGTMGVTGSLRNDFATARGVKVTAQFIRHGWFSSTVAQTLTQDLGQVQPGASTSYSLHSSADVGQDGDCKVSVTTY